ncbi:MAG: RNA 2',3'-cyclic phosphodiesterase [Planctomycetota bacterium]
MKTRTFIAIEASHEIRSGAQTLADQLSPHTKNIRWVVEGALHYTLEFLGDITDQEIVDVCTRVGRVASSTPPFALQALGAYAFPSIDRPRTLWIGAGRGQEDLIALQSEVEESLSDLGFRGENRRYVPHLTIGKTARAGGAAAELTPLLAELAQFDAGEMAVTEVTVFASKLLREGPEYHVLARCPLEG